jgi:hypothetical protein
MVEVLAGLDNSYIESKIGPPNPQHYYRVEEPGFVAVVLNYAILHGLSSAFGPKEVQAEMAKPILERKAVVHTEPVQGIMNAPMYIVEYVAGGRDKDGTERVFVIYESFPDLQDVRSYARGRFVKVEETA